MPLSPGQRLASYEIISPLGAGGMGEVYRARDSKLDRDVAIKILPHAFAADADRVASFEREAKTLATRNHPHIAQIYGVEEGQVGQAGPVKALVMELVEGETLADRIARGALPVEDALTIARQLAEALEAAHERGIIHRDLKPANIKVRGDGTVKVLDFGLAKGIESPHGNSVATASPTITSPAMTHAGVILGTAAYMSPEQARGRPVDKRADIWAFGCLLYEMLTGRPAFPGATIADTIGAILEREPTWDALPPMTLPAVRRLLRRCLEKDPTQRLRDIGDVRHDLEVAVATWGWTRWAAVAVVSLAVVTGAIAFVFWPHEPATPPQLTYTQLTNFADSAVAPALSPGTRGRVTCSAHSRWV